MVTLRLLCLTAQVTGWDGLQGHDEQGVTSLKSQGVYGIVRSMRQLTKGEARRRYISGPRRDPHPYLGLEGGPKEVLLDSPGTWLVHSQSG
jgi:hypothetical protein